ncbi:hypothetical protein CCR75_004355 [Bremia lactucae]|uniref:Homologous-pairing protein 2 homolog n=1 Tax=Bremia lactucae TaxID=4779 RepID=A0A976FK17_BRELC|nr:hypothetical protein CCR75_004355 [Bremia lactucae]
MSDSNDDDFSLNDSEDERFHETEEEEDDYAAVSDVSDTHEFESKLQSAHKTPLLKKKAIRLATKTIASKTGPSASNQSTSFSSKTSLKSAYLNAEDAETAVLDYMRKTNRPYSLLNIFENMHKGIAKPTLTRMLDNLVVKQELVSKTYGKATIYYLNQNKLPIPSEEEHKTIEAEIQTLTAECATYEQELKSAKATLAATMAQLSDIDLESALKELEATAATFEAKVASLDKNTCLPVSPGAKNTLKRNFIKYRTAWVARKRIAMDGINQIADGMEKKPKAILELVGVETDEDVGMKELPRI